MLSKAKIFITHGGFKSLKKAPCLGIPMIMIPASNNYDQALYDQALSANLTQSIGTAKPLWLKNVN